MEQVRAIINIMAGACAGVLTWVFGAPDAWLYAMLGAIVLDYITGVVAAWFSKTLSSEAGFKGLAKKLLILSIVALANILDVAVGASGVLRSVVIGFYIANEGLSLLENAARCGVPFPNKMLEALKQLQSGEKKEKPE